MKSIETQGKTVDQAIELGLYKLGVTRDQVKITILEQAGLFNKARVKLSIGSESESESSLKTMIENLVEKMGLDVNVSVEEQEENFLVNVAGEDSAIIIGKRGENLDEFQFLVNTIYNKGKTHEEYKRVVIDSNNYKSRREDTLKILAQRTAARAVRENHDIRLEPMSANERRIIHSTLADHAKVETESKGNEPNRYVVVKIKNRKTNDEVNKSREDAE
ncbi:MAG: KH domain-containing protein [Clostridia bacterium]|nr:KH domain-containing protein [Clostridia bacterium]